VTDISQTADPRSRLLSAALALFGECGSRGATTRRIAEAAGVNEVTLFRLFGSKRALLNAAVEQSRDAVIGAADAPLPAEPHDVVAELSAWADVHWRSMRERRAIIRKMMSEAEEQPQITQCLGEGWMQSQSAVNRYLQRLKDRGQLAADVNVQTAVTMLGGVLFADAMARDVMMPAALPSAGTAVMEYTTLFLRAIGYSPTAATRTP
jgi:AcrR family transcriptional regulator